MSGDREGHGVAGAVGVHDRKRIGTGRRPRRDRVLDRLSVRGTCVLAWRERYHAGRV